MLEASMDKEFLDGLIDTYKPRYLWMPDDQIG